MTWDSILPHRWSITVKVPVVVALFMAAISGIITSGVLDRLALTQQRNFEDLAGVYLDALSSALIPFVLRDDTWEVFDALDRASSLGTFGKVEVVVASTQGEILASTDPRKLRPATPLPVEWSGRVPEPSGVAVDAGTGRAEAKRKLAYQGRDLGTLYASFDISTLLRERAEVFRTLLLTNAALTLAMMAAAYFAVRAMVTPIRLLSTHLHRTETGRVEAVQEGYVARLSGEYGSLFRRFNAMATAVNEREALASHLAHEERLASLGRLASGMAHEINNPLGGLFNALSTLRRHGHDPAVRERSLGLLERGLAHVRDVVRAALVTYKTEAVARFLKPGDIDDLKVLIEPEVIRKDLLLSWENEVRSSVSVPAGLVRQATLNLLLNAVEATPPGGRVGFGAFVSEAGLHVVIDDSGPGIAADKKAYLETSGEPSPPPGDGLGVWIVRRLVSEAKGHIVVEAVPKLGGTRIRLMLPTQSEPPPAPPAAGRKPRSWMERTGHAT